MQPASSMNRAPNVCFACKARKKTCDKFLPTCSFCARHRLRCDYNFERTPRKKRVYDPGRHFIRLAPDPELEDNNVCELNGGAPPKLPNRSTVHDQNHAILNVTAGGSSSAAARAEDQVVGTFFETINKAFPVIQPEAFHADVLKHLRDGEQTQPNADFTALTLAMLAITRQPASERHALCDKYTQAKYAVAQALASNVISLRILQAAFLTALREYVGLRPEAAYVSLVTCKGICEVLAARQSGVATISESQPGYDCLTRDREVQMVAWAISMLERLILCDTENRLSTQMQIYSAKPRGFPSGWNADLEQIDRHEPVIALIGDVLLANEMPTDVDARMAVLEELDLKARTFLAAIMADLNDNPGLCSVPTSLCTRLLFLIHESVLDLIDQSTSKDSDRIERSCAALDMASRMMLDINSSHSEVPPQPMPICCFYNMKAARKHLQRRLHLQDGPVQNVQLKMDIDTLVRAEQDYQRTWAL